MATSCPKSTIPEAYAGLRSRLVTSRVEGDILEVHPSVILYLRERKMTAEELLKTKRQEILRIAAQYGARNVRVFGSVARGEADDRSDIDLLVEMEPGRSLLDLGGLQYELERLFGRPVDVVTERGLKARIRDRILREAIPV